MKPFLLFFTNLINYIMFERLYKILFQSFNDELLISCHRMNTEFYFMYRNTNENNFHRHVYVCIYIREKNNTVYLILIKIMLHWLQRSQVIVFIRCSRQRWLHIEKWSRFLICSVIHRVTKRRNKWIMSHWWCWWCWWCAIWKIVCGWWWVIWIRMMNVAIE